MSDNTLTEAVALSWRSHDWAALSRTVDVGARETGRRGHLRVLPDLS